MYTVPVPQNKFSQPVRERLGEAIYLLGHLLQRANWETGRLLVTCESLEQETGFPERTIRRWLHVLAQSGEISASRVRNGTLVTILDFASVARTRKATYRPPADVKARYQRPQLAEESAAAGRSDRPRVADEPAVDGHVHRPRTADLEAVGGRSNIKRNMREREIPNVSSKGSSLSSSHPGAPDSARGNETNGGEVTGGIATVLELPREQIQEMLDSLSDEERTELRAQAMEEMMQEKSRFFRNVLRRDAGGRLEPKTELSERLITPFMLRILMRRAGTA